MAGHRRTCFQTIHIRANYLPHWLVGLRHVVQVVGQVRLHTAAIVPNKGSLIYSHANWREARGYLCGC